MEDVVEYAIQNNWQKDYKNPITNFTYQITEAHNYSYEKIPVVDVVGNFVGFVNVDVDKRPI